MIDRTWILGALALAACSGSPDMMGSDSGPGGDPGDDAGSMMPGDDAGTMPGDDAGTTAGDDAGPGGSLDCPGTLPEVDIRFGGCGELTACGGDPTGVWVYEDACIEDPSPDLSDVCADARIEDLEGTARGCVALAGGALERDVSGSWSATVVVPASCTFGTGCSAVESALASAFPGTTCTLDGGDCRCPIGDDWASSGGDTYTVAGSVLTTGDGSQYDFCAGGDLTYRERGDDPREPGLFRLTE
jgi:hypothetical protein